MKRMINGIIRVVLGVIVVIFIIFFSEITVVIVKVFEKFSPDNSLTIDTQFLIKLIYIVFLGLLTFAILLSYSPVRKRLSDLFTYFVNIKKINNIMLVDGILGKKWLNLIIITVGTIASSLIIFVYLFSGVIEQEGTFEMVGSLSFLLSSFMLLFSFFRISFKNYRGTTVFVIRTILIGVSFLLFIVFGEEISWGQHFFNWEATGIFKEANYQQETNFHNFFNPILKYLYPAFGIGLLIFLTLIWFFPNKTTFAFELLFPPSSLFFITVFLSGTAILTHHEPFEQIFGLFTLFYSLRIAVCSIYLAKNHKLQKFNEQTGAQTVGI